ncbi:hypothetical protein KA071_02435 [Candidatus Gracilibacteria bacterium]|nr:hypothetical protein [Candidatus Gracilibacteria bacterium]
MIHLVKRVPILEKANSKTSGQNRINFIILDAHNCTKIMRISTLKKPIIEYPGVQDLLYQYISATDHDREITFYLSAKREIARARVEELLNRTGKQISENVIPEKPDLCGACHELRNTVCVIAANCTRSFCNPHCLHSDYAGINPFIDSMLFLLHCGGFLPEDKFIHASAFLRLLGKRKYAADQIAGPTEQDFSLGQKYWEIFGENNPHLSFGQFTEGISAGLDEKRLQRNMKIQKAFDEKASPLIQDAVDVIRKGLGTEITLELKQEQFFTDIRTKIKAKMETISPIFWEVTSIF